MCGITGTIRFDPSPDRSPGPADVQAMTRALAHRGPHGEGLWTGRRVSLGHRRLAILDLSDAGAQPMTRGQLVLTYNGELYNHRSLRAQLAGHHRFTSGTDTEVILAAWQRWGTAACERFEGMYAFALTDTSTGAVHLVRDRLGIKPLYYQRNAAFLIFASEVEALLHSPWVERRPDLHTWTRQLLCSSTLQVDRDATLLADTRAVPAASCLTVHPDGRVSTSRYWTLPPHDPGLAGLPTPEAGEQLRDLLTSTTTAMRMGDVPVAAFLSGGLDSSAITATAAASGPISALTIVHTNPVTGLPPQDDADLHHSRLLAAACPGIEHHVSVHPTGVGLGDLDAVCDLAALGEDPRHLAILANYRAVAELGLRVVLNGQGADETMGGYVARPTFVAHILDLRQPSTATIEGLPASRQATHLSANTLAHRRAAHAEVLAFHRGLSGPPLESAHRLLTALQLARIVQFEDHLAMRAGVEARFPFLGHQLIEWCFAQPFAAHIATAGPGPTPGSPTGKALLRSAMTALLPAAILNRPKQVFPHPDPAGLQQTLAGLARRHERTVRADPLVTHLFQLPPPGHLPHLPAASLWLVLMTWRWHVAVQRPRQAPAPPEPVPTGRSTT